MHDTLLKKTQIKIHEKIVFGLFAFMNAVGATGIFTTILSYLTSPVSLGGLGVILGLASLPVIIGIGAVSAVFVVPLTYSSYKSLVNETERLQRAILKGIEEQKKLYDKIFFEMLRLRSLCSNDFYFEGAIATKYSENWQDIDRIKLMDLVERVYRKYSNHKYILDWKKSESSPSVVRCGEDHPRGMTFSNLLRDFHIETNDDFRDSVLANIKEIYHDDLPDTAQADKKDFDKMLSACFEPVRIEEKSRRMKAAIYGVLAGASIAGTGLGTVSAFAGLILGAAIAASIPIVGWIVIGVACIAIGVAIGLTIGLAKQKNVDRDAYNQSLDASNKRVDYAKKDVAIVCVKQTVEMKEKMSDDPRRREEERLPDFAVSRNPGKDEIGVSIRSGFFQRGVSVKHPHGADEHRDDADNQRCEWRI